MGSSIVDVAREAKVSLGTVSMVLNHRHRVAPKTCQRVEQVIERMGYKPRGRRHTAKPAGVRHLAFLYTLNTLDNTSDHGMTNYCRELIEGVKSKLDESCSLSIVRSADHVDHDLMFRQQLDAHEFDGIILFGPHTSNGYLEQLETAGLPLVVFNHMSFQGWFSSVTVDYYGAMRKLMAHLAKLGHRRIACFGMENQPKWTVRQTRESLQSAAAQFGCEVIDIEMNPSSEEKSTEDILDACQKALDQKATAFFTGDPWAIQIADALAGMGVSVPEDVSVVGFDDRHLVTQQGLKLTSVGYDRRRMGRMALQMLQQMIEGSGKWEWMAAAATTYLFEGQTCGPAKG